MQSLKGSFSEMHEAAVSAQILNAIETVKNWRREGRAISDAERLTYAYLYARRVSLPHKRPPRITSDLRFISWVFKETGVGERTLSHTVGDIEGAGRAAIVDGLVVRPHDDRATVVNVRIPEFSFRMLPGFIATTRPITGDLTRIYFALRPQTAPWFLRKLAGAYQDSGLPSALKVLANPHSYDRADAGVVYVLRECREDALQIAIDVTGKNKIILRDLTPLGTSPVAQGIGWADGFETPLAKSAPSFGQWLSSVIVDCAYGENGAVGSIEATFLAHGRSLTEPYRALN